MQPYLHLDGQGVNGLILWIVGDAIFGFDLNLIDGGYSPSYLLILTSRANRKNCVLSRMQTFFAVFFFWGKGPCSRTRTRNGSLTFRSQNNDVRTIRDIREFYAENPYAYEYVHDEFQHGEPDVKTRHVEFELNSDRIIALVSILRLYILYIC